MLRAFALAAALGAASLGCVAKPPLTSPASGGAAWSELRSDHFVLYTDREAGEARAALAEYESIHDVFTNVVLSGDLGDPVPIQIILFDREVDYQSIAPRGSQAFFMPRLPHDPEPLPTLVLWGDLVESRRRTFQHELAHHVFHRVLGPAPAWLHEGLAEYYETMQIEDGAVILGAPQVKYGFFRGSTWAFTDKGSYTQAMIPISQMSRASELISMNRETFYERNHEGEPTREETRRRITHYAGSWALVHMLNHTPGYSDAYAEFLSLLTAGKGYEEALSKGLGGLVETANDDLLAYLTAPERLMAKTSYTPKKPAPPRTERFLPDPEVRVLWNRLRPWGNDGEVDMARSNAVKAEFDDAVTRAPDSPVVRLYRGLFHVEAQELDAAERDLTVAFQKAPEDTGVLIGVVRLCSARTKAKQKTEFCGKNGVSVIETLARVAKTASSHDTAAKLLFRAGKPDEALEHAKLAVKTDPGCADCLDTLAFLCASRQLFREAVTFEERAIAALPESHVDRSYTHRLLMYRRALIAQKRKAAEDEVTPLEAPAPE